MGLTLSNNFDRRLCRPATFAVYHSAVPVDCPARVVLLSYSISRESCCCVGWRLMTSLSFQTYIWLVVTKQFNTTTRSVTHGRKLQKSRSVISLQCSQCTNVDAQLIYLHRPAVLFTHAGGYLATRRVMTSRCLKYQRNMPTNRLPTTAKGKNWCPGSRSPRDAAQITPHSAGAAPRTADASICPAPLTAPSCPAGADLLTSTTGRNTRQLHGIAQPQSHKWTPQSHRCSAGALHLVIASIIQQAHLSS
jgi:hypothetical protein